MAPRLPPVLPALELPPRVHRDQVHQAALDLLRPPHRDLATAPWPDRLALSPLALLVPLELWVWPLPCSLEIQTILAVNLKRLQGLMWISV
jgi:hypothetical protein